MRQTLIARAMILNLFVIFIGCKGDLTSKELTLQLGTEEEIIAPVSPLRPPSTPSISNPLTNYVVGVGVGGYKIVSNAESLSAEYEFNISRDDYNVSPPNCGNNTAIVMEVNNGERCCFSDTQECFGSGGHSDYLWRSVAFGNGLFVAVGGWSHGIIISRSDGENWSEKINLHSSNTL